MCMSHRCWHWRQGRRHLGSSGAMQGTPAGSTLPEGRQAPGALAGSTAGGTLLAREQPEVRSMQYRGSWTMWQAMQRAVPCQLASGGRRYSGQPTRAAVALALHLLGASGQASGHWGAPPAEPAGPDWPGSCPAPPHAAHAVPRTCRSSLFSAGPGAWKPCCL